MPGETAIPFLISIMQLSYRIFENQS